MPEKQKPFNELSERDLLIHLCTSSARQDEQIKSVKEILNRHLSHHWASYLAMGTVILGVILAR